MRRQGVVVAVALLLVAGCGGEDPPEEPLPTVAPTVSAPPPAEPADEPTPAPVAEPDASQERYEVQPGDTLSEIAERFSTTVEALVEANDIEDPDRIQPGQQLTLPQ